MNKRRFTVAWLVISLLFLLTWVTPLSVNNHMVRYLFLLVSITGYSFIRWRYALPEERIGKGRRFKALLFSFLFLVSIYEVLLNWGGDWKTQSIKYEHVYWPNRQIEFQMQDVGSLGYNRRTVDRTKLLPFVDWVMPIKEPARFQADSVTWKKVDIDVNELGLIFP